MKSTNQDKIWKLAAAEIHRETGDGEKMELKQLMQHSDDATIYREVIRLHEGLEAGSPLCHASRFRSWDNVTSYFRKQQIRLALQIIKYAAIIVLAFGIGTFFHFNLKPQPEISPVYSEVIVPPGQMSEITLSDGTHVWLNSGTTLRYPGNFGENARQIELTGEAFFKVKKGEIPFRVKLKDNEVEVLGTSFAAMAYPDEDFSRVTLVEGSVQVSDNSGRALKQLRPKQQVTIPDNRQQKIKTTEVNTTFYESWINGEIKFDNEQLADVARRLERWYNVEIRFADEKAANLRFTGTVLKNKSIDQSMKAISTLLRLDVKLESKRDSKDVITISKKNVPMRN